MINNKWSIRAASVVSAAAIAIGVGGGTALAADDSAASLSELSTKLEAAMKNRPSKYEFTYTGPSLAKTDLTNMFIDIYSRNDYLKYSTKTYQGNSAGTFGFTYWESVTQATYVQSKVTEVLGGIITTGMNDFQKEKAIHDWIEKNLSYDTTLKQHSAYAGLVPPFKTVCQGYALLANRMLTDAGIENRIIEGKAGGQLHTWNLVKLEGKWYHLDTTWDDPVPDVSDRVVYSYYNLTDNEIAVDHTWTRDKYPAANTDFEQTLIEKQKTGDSVTNAVYKNIYDAVGLELKDPANTVSRSSELSAKVQQAMAANKTSFKFRHTSKATAVADLKAAMANMKNVKSYSLSVTAYPHTTDSTDVLLDVQQFKYSPPVDVQTVSLSTYSVNLKLGAAASAATITLKANITPNDATNKSVVWTSDNKEVATVSATGAVKALKVGSAKITATTASGNLTSTADVTVTQAVARLTVSKSVYTLKVGEPDYTIVPTILPATATNKQITWTSNNSSVTVDSYGTIHAVAPGVALITATTKDGNKKASTTVRVPTNASGVTLLKSDLTLKLGTSGAALRAIVAPVKATDKVVTWSSDDTSVATVTATGLVKPVKEGTAIITASTRDGGFKATANVTVIRGITSITLDQSKLTVKVGGPDKLLTATINPSDTTNKNVTWSSNKPSIVTVDSSGNVHAIASGTTYITVTSVQDKTKVARAVVTVPVNVTGIALNTNKVDIKVSKTFLIKATIAPANATTKTYSWSSSNNAVASVSSTGVVTALSAGTADITVTSTDGNFTATATITVSSS